MEVEIQIPEEVPVMTLPNVTFFPQSLMPLHIFEPRYRRMLRDVLGANRTFAVAGLDLGAAGKAGPPEPPHRVACLGLIRACQKGEDGTSDLLLQGLCRVAIESIVGERPYRRIRVRALASTPGAQAAENERLRGELARLARLKAKLTPEGGRGIVEVLRGIDDPDVFADLAAFGLCDDAALRQTLLETLDVNRRLVLLLRRFQQEIDAAALRRKLQGGLADGDIGHN